MSIIEERHYSIPRDDGAGNDILKDTIGSGFRRMVVLGFKPCQTSSNVTTESHGKSPPFGGVGFVTVKNLIAAK